jgi:hypothetical protein
VTDEPETAGHDQRAASAVTVRCAWCRRIRVGHEWREEADFEAMRLLERVKQFSDGICPDCLAHYTDRSV